MKPSDYRALGLIPTQNPVELPYGPKNIAEILDQPVKDCPDDLAIADDDVSYTYQELYRAVTAACDFFKARGIGVGSRVAGSMPNRCDLIVAFLATQKLGAVWVGINTILPADDKRFILAHSETKLLLADTAVTAQVGEFADEITTLKHVECVDGDSDWARALKSSPPEQLYDRIDSFAPAAIMYTSGTTGIPKGVVHSQHNLMTPASVVSKHGFLAPQSRRGCILPLTITNLIVGAVLNALANGKACICTKNIKPHDVSKWMFERDIESITLVPTMIYDFLDQDLPIPESTSVSTGGAPLPEAVRKRFTERYGREITQSYGLTEAPTVVSHSRGLPSPEGASGLIDPQFDVIIRDNDGNPSTDDKTGEICLAAAKSGYWKGVYAPPLGYWKDPEKTAALLADGVVHTGDVGYVENDWIYIADRGVDLILRGGSNIYPAEVERVLHSNSNVAACALVGKPDLRLGNLCVAFVQPADNIDTETLRDELDALCREKLAKYKKPDEWRFVEQFPRNAMGKIKKPALREMLREEADQ